MFNNLFSSTGRIRRLEYGLSLIIYLGGLVFLNLLTIDRHSTLIMLLNIPLYWFLLAQGAKRCHDINNSGWYQVIPLYFFWMVFEEGTSSINEYGYNPKNESIYQSPAVKPVSNKSFLNDTLYPLPQSLYTTPISNVIHSLQQQKTAPLNQQTVLEVMNVNYGLTQDVLKKLRLLDKTNSLSYTLSATTALITISHSNTSQALLDDLYQIMSNIDVLEIKPGNISIKIK